jgi:hypothetical protein
MLNAEITGTVYQSRRLQGGTVGDVELITGAAETADGGKLPFKIVLKTQKKWERYGDPGSWRREYDFYMSDFGSVFSGTPGLRWAECYRAEMNADENEYRLWLEYIAGASGTDLTGGMYERAALSSGGFRADYTRNSPPSCKA